MSDPSVNADGTGNLSNVTNGVYNGVSDIGRNPMLLPNMDYTLMLNGGQSTVSTQQYLDQFPRGQASGTATIGGTVTEDDELTITLAGHASNYTAGASDTVDTEAAGLADAINSNSNVNQLVVATSSGAVVTIKAINGGPVGNSITFTVSKSGGATETITASPTTGLLAGGTGAVIPTTDFPYTWNGSLLQFWKGKPIDLSDNNLVAALAALNVIQ